MLPENDMDALRVDTPTNGATRPTDGLDGPRHTPEAFVLDLSAEHPFFEGEGEVTVRIGRQRITFQLRSVPYDTLQRALALLEPRVPKVIDKETRKPVKDLEHPLYQEWDQFYPYLKILLGLRQVVLRDAHGTVVWQHRGEPTDDAELFFAVTSTDAPVRAVWGPKFRAATQALRDMKITAGHVVALSAAIDELSKAEEADSTAEMLGE